MPRARRSCLTVPGDDERKLARAATIQADEVILDLEDAVPPARKDEARAIVERALADLRFAAATVAIRVNRGADDDLALVRAVKPDIVVFPKVESPDELAMIPVPAEAQIETARGLAECERIAAAPGLEALVLGAGDLAASLGVPELTIGEGAHVEHALMRVLVAARACGVSAVDGPYVKLDDSGGLRRAAMRSRAFGYDGKWCIHPAQIEICNEVYSPTQEEIERARRILGVEGVARVDGEMVDEANRRMAEAILARLPTV
ncbi:MAG: HpcH/HpaI aldolase/citrate lyase family protein [Gaiellaceae bacterium]